MDGRKTERFFCAFRYLLVLYAVLFAMLFSALIPILLGFQVSIVQHGIGDMKIPAGSVVISKPLMAEAMHLNEEKDLRREGQIKEGADIIFVHVKQEMSESVNTLWNGRYLYHVPLVGYMIEPLKQGILPFLMCCLLFYLFTFTLASPKKSGRLKD